MGPVGERRSLPGLKPNPTFTANAARFTMALHGLRLLVLLLALCSAPRGYARHQYTSRIPNGSRVPCPEAGDSHCQTAEESCGGVGHASCAGGATSPALNAFGKDLLAAGIQWTKELCEKDSDGDGFSNGEELGDPCCVWSEGVEMPGWMRDWPISHPGFEESRQLHDWDEELCEGVGALEGARFYNPGEEKISWEFRIKKHVLPAKDTQYYDVRFNFPDDELYYLVGADALVDNADAVHHYLLTTCSSKVSAEVEGVPLDMSDGMDADCAATIWGWGPGGRYKMPLSAAFPIGGKTGIVGINIEIHYDNVHLIEGRTDSSGIRFHLTKTPLTHETGNFFTGGGVSVGTIYPNTVVYSSTVVQVKLNKDIAPDGITIFGFTPHMHALGRKMWVEKFRKPLDKTDMLLDLTKLEKIEDIGRDDTWRINDQGTQDIEWVTVQDGDFISTTCIFDSEIRNTTTIGGFSSQQEMCIGFLSYYPAEGADGLITHSGPKYFDEIYPEAYSMNSFADILALPETDSQLPKWREAYLTGHLKCQEEKPNYELDTRQRVIGLYLDEYQQQKIIAACGEEFGAAFFGVVDTAEPPICSKECARATYNLLGCSLVWQARDANGSALEMYPSVLEAHVNDWCGQEFDAVYNEDKAGDM